MEDLRTIAQVIDGAEKIVGGIFNISSPMPGSRIRQLSPFLLIDHFGPSLIEPTEKILGGEPHPHRGFETVTLVYDGYLDHRDTGGHSGSLAPFDVQWMTAGSGVLHEEKFGREFTKNGGTIELIQLWINLPKKDKMVTPRYQELRKESIPVISEDNNKTTFRIIAGNYGDVKGPALTYSPINLWDIKLAKGTEKQLTVPKDYNLGIYVVRGKVKVNNRDASTKQLINFGWDAEHINIQAEEDSLLLILSGEPIEEPLATYGPFAMNTNQELIQALADFETGKFGQFQEK
jgi:redox-sensitive bicupin YhaK (pirin superfamily)